MKFIGFIKEQDRNIGTSKPLEEMFVSNDNDIFLVDKVIDYLNSGVFVTGVMSFIYDDEQQPIGNLDYFTDGEFIWPIYYPYYLKKYKNFFLDPIFVAHLHINKFTIPFVDEEKLIRIDKQFCEEWSKKKS